MGLVVCLAVGEYITIGNVAVKFSDRAGRKIKLHIEAPKEVLISRVISDTNYSDTRMDCGNGKI